LLRREYLHIGNGTELTNRHPSVNRSTPLQRVCSLSKPTVQRLYVTAERPKMTKETRFDDACMYIIVK
jgi:hypothetical protein